MRAGQRRRRIVGVGAALLMAAVMAPACATSGGSAKYRPGDVLPVAAAENFWGSLAVQLGGARAHVTSIIDNPNADPHDYEPTAADARALASAQVAIVNGVGYDEWASRLLDANPVDGRAVLTVGDVVGVETGGNPHRWYSPPDVRQVVDAITAAYQRVDPADADYFDRQHSRVLRDNLAPYFAAVDDIKAQYAGTPVGASESLVTPLAEALGLDLRTPASFLEAVSEGSDPTADDKVTIDRQISDHAIDVFLYNSQNATPDVQAQVDAAREQEIPTVTLTETMTPASASFQQWQVRQLQQLQQALATGTAR